MKQLPKFPDRYWLKFSADPVELKPFDPKSKQIAQTYIKRLEKLTSSFEIQEIYHRGSTGLGISGKGDVEIGLILKEEYWFEVIVCLANQYEGLGNLDEDYCRFNDELDGFEIEIILMRGYTARLDKKIHEYLLAHPDLLKEYEEVKKEYRFSNREYNKNKDKFLEK